MSRMKLFRGNGCKLSRIMLGIVLLLSALPAYAADDHYAFVYRTGGSVRILKKSAEKWEAVSKGERLEQGDQLITGMQSFVEFYYDEAFRNIARIEENTKAEFKSIEPTDLQLEDGTIFNALDGLGAAELYQISTPTAVASVRGTHFDANYSAESGEASFATFPVPDDGRDSVVQVTDVLDSGETGGSVQIPEGSELDLAAGAVLDPAAIAAIDPERVEARQETFEQMASEVGEVREEPQPNAPDASAAGENAQPSKDAEANEAAIDEAVDEVIPPADMPVTEADPNGLPSGPDSSAQPPKPEGLALPSGAMQQAPDGTGPKQPAVFADALGQFVEVGLKNQGPMTSDQVQDKTVAALENMGFESEFALGFGNVMAKFFDVSGDFSNFLTTESGSSAVAEVLDVTPEEVENTLNKLGIDIPDTIPVITTDDLGNNDVAIADAVLAASNPYYNKVLDGLERDLTATEKSMILADHNLEISRGSPVEMNVDTDAALEQVVGVTYLYSAPLNDINAEYSRILNAVSEGGGVLQPSQSAPYLIVAVSACNSSDPEAGC